jgi:hypothetical protein
MTAPPLQQPTDDPSLLSSKEELAAALRIAERAVREAKTTLLSVVKAVDDKKAAKWFGQADTAALLEELLMFSPAEAGKCVLRARAFCGERSLTTGEMLPPKLEFAGAAMRRGELADSQLDAIRSIITKLPRRVTFEDRRFAEQALVGGATQLRARELYQLGNRVHGHLDPDGTAPSEKDNARPRRELYVRTGTDGRISLRGSLDPETGNLLQEVLSPLAKPRTEDNGKTKDPRSTAERNGDALAEVLNLVADSEKLPIQGGERPHLTITPPWAMLKDRVGLVRGYENMVLSPEAARRLACDCDITPIVLGADDEPLNAGRTERLVTKTIRKALIARDKGCAMKGCTRPARWTRAHHVISWVDGGETSLDNCVLLCDRHHRQIHHGDWQVRIVDGIPEFIPPLYVDFEQKPIRNTYHLFD